ncbi:hypothetical protein DFQ27_006049 [Actinomortierella ambigua]|uniref:Uncharacterized protein n=1 Tax=Actinomortierella ambigua TaxID=1343610 RepID=A0A9P6QHF6_9FUNG|nr:hypothetical protein DFQ27_006049 [Actinomortierella ambigua]
MWPVQIYQTHAHAVLAIPQTHILPGSLEALLIEPRHSLSLTWAILNHADTEAVSRITFRCAVRPLLKNAGSDDAVPAIQSFRYTQTDTSLIVVLNKEVPLEWQAIELEVSEEGDGTKAACTAETRVFSFVTESNLATTQSRLREATPWMASDVRVGKVAAKRVPATNNISIVAEAVPARGHPSA